MTDSTYLEPLLDAHPELDLERVRYWVGEFAAVLEAPEILDDLETMLTWKMRWSFGESPIWWFGWFTTLNEVDIMAMLKPLGSEERSRLSEQLEPKGPARSA